MDNGVIKESELIQLDGTIDKLIESISGLGSEYSKAAELIKNAAAGISSSLKSVSGATKQGRQAIDESAKAADRLAAAEETLKFALSETGKQVAWLKAQTADANKATVEQQRQIRAAATSYDRLKADIKELTGFFKSLTKAEREDVEFGGQVIAELREKSAQLKALNNSIKPVVQSMTLLQKTEQQLAYWQSEEGKKVLELRKQIRELTSDRKEEKEEIDAVTKAQQKLAYEQSTEAKTLAELTEKIKKQREENRLSAKEAVYTGTTYKDLSVQYSIVKAKIDALDKSSENYEQTLEELTNKAAVLHAQMNAMQKSTGNYALNVGNYTSAFDGFGNSVQQIIRELPTLKFGLDQFFLAISNNIPIFADMYDAEKKAFGLAKEAIMKEGKLLGESADITAAKISALDTPIKKLTKSIFSWRTALMIGVTVFTLWGDAIIKWIGSLFTGKSALANLKKATEAVNKELKSSAHGFDDNMTTVRKLSREWKTLKTTAEKTKWIKDNESAWSRLDVAMTGVQDAEELFVRNTAAVQKAFALRAKAAAAEELAKKKYAELLKLEVQREQQENTKKFLDSQQAAASGPYAMTVSSPTTGSTGTNYAAMAAANALALRNTNNQIDAINAEIEAYFKLGAAARGTSDEILGLYTKRENTTEKGLDLEEYIASMRLKVIRATEEARTRIETDGFRQREAEALKSYTNETESLLNAKRRNERILSGDLKTKQALTPEYRKKLEEENANIDKALSLFKQGYDTIVKQIFADEKVAALRAANELIDMRLEAVQEGSKEELNLRLQQIENEKQAALTANELVAEAEKQNVQDIIAYYDRLKTYTKGSAAVTKATTARTARTAYLTRVVSSGKGKPRRQALKEFGAEDSRKRQVYDIDTDLIGIEAQLSQYYQNKLNLSAEEVANLKLQREQLKAQKKELSGFSGVISGIAEDGLGGGLLGALGLDEAGIEAFNIAVNAVMDGLSELFAMEIEMAEQAVEAAQERVDAAQSAYDAEIEARNNGYANSVETARKELEQEKKNEEEKQKMLEQARKKQQALDAATQASSLVTAVAGLWASYSMMGPASVVLAGIATAALFAAFVASQVKAAQVAKQQYGEGGLEFLEGGSHASGNDIDLGTTNGKGKRMYAEGGEAMAIINKRSTRRYKDVLPSIVDSLNKGTFEEKFLNAFNSPGIYEMAFAGGNTDLSRLESDVRKIREQGDSRTHVLPDGSMIIYYKNVRRIVRKS